MCISVPSERLQYKKENWKMHGANMRSNQVGWTGEDKHKLEEDECSFG